MDATDDQERTRLKAFLSEARQELTVLEQLWLVTCPQLGIPLLLGSEAEDILDRAVIAHHADFGSLQIWDETEQCLYLIAQCNFDHSLIDRFAAVREGDGTLHQAAKMSSKTMPLRRFGTGRNPWVSGQSSASRCSGIREGSWGLFPVTIPDRFPFQMTRKS
ncbi:hypothetical protein ACQY1H_23720 (plasmid) [Agrobacterium vitis]|uniref:hypothetical protein n=1 Tax=Agrobacterium vitis TaxID=373 RepID=UPI003D266B60